MAIFLIDTGKKRTMSDQSSTSSQEDIKVILISLVRQHPSIYDPGHVDYKNRVLKDKMWTQINNDIGIPDFDARKEWTTLRNYANSHRDRLKIPSGRATSSTTSWGKRKKSEWQYAAEMQFLLPHLGQHREMESTMRKSSGGSKGPASLANSDILMAAIECSEIAEDTVNEQRQTPSTSMSSAPKKPKLPQKTSIDMYCEAVTKMIENKEEPRPENPEVGWFRSLLHQIELLSPIGQGQYQNIMQGQGQYPNIMQGQGQLSKYASPTSALQWVKNMLLHSKETSGHLSI
ncbi:hypothetical protein RRG08_037470 [Elysia crispata]|uniref:MADF domain-containing protein n=1 Tax=Elysia crispata TaxID=231223 RepID=A0AAE1AZW9_9GAST|nr:hypothetical protein RRG08_037470 [Elysia crispata]